MIHARASGLLLHVTSLPSPYGIGDVGPAALSWIDRLQQAGQSWWQALPLGPTGYGNSPYQPLSSFAGNGLVISPEWLIEDGLLQATDCQAGPFPQHETDYNAVIPFKHRILETAWANFMAGRRSDLRPAYEQFCHDQAHWLEDYALFRALKARFAGAYVEWPAELVQRDGSALDRARRELADRIGLAYFVQFVLSRQAERLKAYAHGKSVKLIGDLPFFVSPDSSDVWAHPELFLLDQQRRPHFVAGVPPDYFSSTGQLWGNPALQLGMHFETRAIAGGLTVFTRCSPTLMWRFRSGSLSRLHCRLFCPRRRTYGRSQVIGGRVQAPTSFVPLKPSWYRCHSSLRIWDGSPRTCMRSATSFNCRGCGSCNSLSTAILTTRTCQPTT